MTDDPFIRRSFDLAPDQRVIVTWYRPEEDDACWRCRYWIQWPDRDRHFAAAGFDPVQALMHGLTMVHVELRCSDEWTSGRLTLNSDRELDLPLP